MWRDKEEKMPDTREQSANTVVMGIDDNAVYATAVLWKSLQGSARTSFQIVLGYLDGDLLPRNLEILAAVAAALGIELESRPYVADKRFVPQRHVSSSTFLKFLLFDDVEGPLLWLDADIVAFDGWDEIFEDAISLAGPNQLVVARKPRGNNRTFNAGVLGFPGERDRGLWKKSELLAAPESSFALEQDIFNAIYGDGCMRISESFNFLSLWEPSLDLIPSDIRFLHYAGPVKPWHLAGHLLQACVKARCSWSPWFVAQQKLHADSSLDHLAEQLQSQRELAAKTFGDWESRQPMFRLIRAGRNPIFWMLARRLVSLVLKSKAKNNPHPFH